MRYIGSFADIYGRVVTVEIENDEPGADIRLDTGGIRFDTAGVTTETSYNDEYDTLMRESCTVKLVVDSPIFALYSRGVLDNRIRVTRDGEPIFTGYVEPQAYTQPFVKVRDTLEVCCIDVFSALQYCLWGDVAAPGVIWEEERVKAGPETVGDILRTVFGKTAPDMAVNITSDLLTADQSTSIADGVMIDTSVFFGDDEESTWTLEEVADAVLTYFNLRACVAGDHIEVYHPDTLGTADEKTIDRSTTWDATHTIEIMETYNRLKLTCERMETEAVIPQPLEDGALMPMFPYPELITTEYWAYGAFDFLRIAGFGGSAWNEQVIYKGGEINHWFRVMKANGWKMRNRYGMYTGGESQRELVNGVQDSHGALFMEVTTGKDEYDSQNNAIPDKADEGRYLVIGVGGFGKNGETYLNNMGQCIKSAMPCATYEGVTATLSPSDDETTRYIVFDGSIRLNPRHNPGLSYDQLATKVHVVPDGNGNPLLSWDDISQCMEDYDTSKEDAKAAVDGEEGKRYYTRRYWHTDTPGGEPENIDGITVPDYGINPMEDDDFFSRYEYKYSAHGDGNDRMRKLPLLSCMLIVGDKCVVESKHTGEIDDYRWVKYKTLAECKDEDEYYAQSFILGVDPKIGDKIIGPSRDITNNIHYSLHLGVKGTAIPVRASDNVGGPVKFMILGPYNAIWDDITRVHPTLFRHTQWSTNPVPLLSHVSAIWIKDFNVKIVSDNAFRDVEDGDLVYVSDTDEEYVNRKDDLNFRFCSALTPEERTALKVRDMVCRNTPIDVTTGNGLLEIYDALRDVTGKPEQLYLDWHWRKSHRARVTLTHGMKDIGGQLDRFICYRHGALPDKRLLVDGISRNLREGSATVQLTEE